MTKIKYPLSEVDKNFFRERLEEVLNQKTGEQVIILWDKEKLTDYYQNTCVPRVIKQIRASAKEYAKISNNELIIDCDNK